MAEAKDKEQDVFELPGEVGRKTGFRMTRTPKKDKNGLENLEDFFLSDDEYSGSESIRPSTSVKKLKLRRQKVHKIVSPEPQVVEVSDGDMPKEYSSSDEDDDNDNEDSRADELIKSAAVFGSPIKPSFRGVNPKSVELGNREEILDESKATSEAGTSEKTTAKTTGGDNLHKKLHAASVEPLEHDVASDSFSNPSGTSKRLFKNSSNLTKQIALHQKGRSKKFDYVAVSSDEDEQLVNGNAKETSKDSIDVNSITSDDSIVSQSEGKKYNSPAPHSTTANKFAGNLDPSQKRIKSRKTSNSKTSSKVIESSRYKPKFKSSAEKPLRHSTRTKVKPVAWWRNERVVYKMKKEHGAYVREVENVVHKPDDLAVDHELHLKRIEARSPSQTPRKRRKASNIIRRTKVIHKSTPEPENLIIDLDADVGTTYADNYKMDNRKYPTAKSSEAKRRRESIGSRRESIQSNHRRKSLSANAHSDAREANWVKDKSLTIPVFDGPGSEKQIERTVAWAPDQSKNITIIRNRKEYFKIKTLFDQDVEFSGAGILELPVNSRKSVKSNEDTYFVFYVIDGTMEVSLSHNVFIVSRGSSFEIPMGNFYRFENRCDKPVKLFFVQSKYVVVADPDDGDLQSTDI